MDNQGGKYGIHNTQSSLREVFDGKETHTFCGPCKTLEGKPTNGILHHPQGRDEVRGTPCEDIQMRADGPAGKRPSACTIFENTKGQAYEGQQVF